MNKLRPFLLLMILLVPVLVLGAQDAPAARLEITGVNATAMPVVTVTANVYDNLGQPLRGLTASDFALTGELVGQAQITSVENISDNNLPFAVVLAIDVSTSMEGTPLDKAKLAARAFVENIGPDDPVAIMTFGSRVRLVQDYTTDKAALLSVIDSVYPAGQTALYQAAYEATRLAAQSPTPRRAVILLSDGAEYGTNSTVARDAAVQEATVRGVPIYTIGLGFGFDRTYLQQLSGSTNAANYESPSPDQLTQIYTDLAAKLRSQYVITLDAPLPLDGTEYDLGLQATTPDGTLSANTTLRAPIPVPVVQLPSLDQPLTEPTQIAATILHDDPLSSVTYQIGDAEPVAFSGEPYTLTLDPFDYPPGPLRLIVSATDADGDTGTDTIDLTIGALPSRVSLSPDLATLGEIAEPQTIAVEVQGQTATTHVITSFNGGDRTELAEPYSFTIDPLQFAPGDNTVVVTVTNAAGATVDQSFPFSIAALPPQIRITGLQDGQAVDAPVSFTADVTAQVAVSQIDATIGDLALLPTDGTYTIDPLALPPGANALIVTATTTSGLSNTVQVNFVVAALPPQIVVNGLTAGETLTADRAVTLDFVTQTPIVHVAFFVDGAPLADQTAEPFGVTLTVLDFAPGDHTLRIIADNDSGQSSTLDLPFTIAVEPAATATQAAVATATQQAVGTAQAVNAVTATQAAQATALEQAFVDATQAAQVTQAAQATALEQAFVDATQVAQTTQAAQATVTEQAFAAATQVAQTTQAAQATATDSARATELANNLATLQMQMTASSQSQQATQALLDLTATQNSLDVTATNSARATELANNLATLQAQMTAAATATQAAVTQQALIEATGSARSTEQAIVAQTGTAVAQVTAAFVSTQAALLEQATQASAATQAALTATQVAQVTQVALDAQATATGNAQVTATNIAQATQSERSTMQAAAAIQAQLATRDTLATANAQARLAALATQNSIATRNAQATNQAIAATRSAEAQATNAINTTATHIADLAATANFDLATRLAGEATSTAAVVRTEAAALQATATQLVLDGTATRQVLEVTATQVSVEQTATAAIELTAAAEQANQQTATAQAVSDNATGTAAANATVRANALATSAQATNDIAASATSDAEGTLNVRQTAVGPTATLRRTPSPLTAVAQAAGTDTSTPQPSATLTEIQAQEPPATSDVTPLIILLVVIIVIIIVVVILMRGRSSNRR